MSALEATPAPAPTRPPMRYHGGKWRLAPKIIGLFPPHRVYVEPFGGGGAVLLRKPKAPREVYNDAWGEVVNVFAVLRDPVKAAELRRLCHLTPYARDEFLLSYEPNDDPVEQARRTIFRSISGFGSAAVNPKHLTGFRANSNRSGTTPAQDWSAWPDFVPAWVERLRGVTIENREAAACMLQHDRPETLHYVDPPYLGEVRSGHPWNNAYALEMRDEAQHRALADVLHGLEGMVVLSGYDGALYRELYAGWETHDLATHADGARPRVERLWLNEAAVRARVRLL